MAVRGFVNVMHMHNVCKKRVWRDLVYVCQCVFHRFATASMWGEQNILSSILRKRLSEAQSTDCVTAIVT